MIRSLLSRAAVRPLGFAPLLCAAALLLCLLAPARPASALTFISTDTTINYVINDNVQISGTPTVNLVDGGSIAGGLTSFGGTLNVSGGTLAGNVSAFNSATINVSGGTIGGTLFAFNSNTVNVSGGTIAGDLGTSSDSTLNVSGGTIGGNLLIRFTARLNVFGTGLSLSALMYDVQIRQLFVVLSGTLADGTPINERVYLLEGAQPSQITLIEVDPFDVLREQVAALGAAGVLNKGNTNALTVKLDAAQAALQSGDTLSARDSLTAFINQVKAFVRTGKLSQAQGAPLIEGAQAILEDIG